MPLLGQAVPRPLAGDRQAVELPAQSHGEVAHVDHFLDFAQGLLGDLSHFPTYQCRQIGLVADGIARRCGEPIRPAAGPARSARRKTPPRPHPPRRATSSADAPGNEASQRAVDGRVDSQRRPMAGLPVAADRDRRGRRGNIKPIEKWANRTGHVSLLQDRRSPAFHAPAG